MKKEGYKRKEYFCINCKAKFIGGGRSKYCFDCKDKIKTEYDNSWNKSWSRTNQYQFIGRDGKVVPNPKPL